MSDLTADALRSAVAGAPIGVALWDAELRYRWVNDVLAEINGVGAAEHLGRTIPEVLPAMPEHVRAVYQRVLDTGEAVDNLVLEGETPAAPGVRRRWKVSIFSTADADGRPDGIASFIEDVTALHQARAEAGTLGEQLALERRVLEEVVERAPLGVTLLWGRELRYRVMNEQGRRMLPDRGPLIGRTPADAFPETAEMFAATVLPLFDSGEELVIREYPLRFDDDVGALDGQRYYDVTFKPIRLDAGPVAGVLVTYVDLTDQLRRQRTLERELDEERRLSDTLQRALLPRRLAAVPHLDVAARYHPAGARYEVGGDFYDLFPGRDDGWVAVVGDVCGKGPRAAARTSMVRYALRAEAAHADGPAHLLELLNDDVRRELEDEGEEDFVTVALVMLRPLAEGTQLLVSTAGHPPAIVTSPAGRWRSLGVAGLPIGIAQAPAYEQRADLLGPGERLILHTDGVLDAHAPQVILSSADLAARAATPGGAEEVADALLAHVTQSAVPARDDCAVLVLAQKP